jgi:uncharacterized protein YcbK (DUF882 family)
MKNRPTEMQLTRNFCLQEFKCKDGTNVPSLLFKNVNALAFNLQILRDHVNKPIQVISGFRTITYNKQVGGSPKSSHLRAMAADIKIPGYSPYDTSRIIEELIFEDFMKQGGIGLYDTFIHYDIRGYKARWDFRTL